MSPHLIITKKENAKFCNKLVLILVRRKFNRVTTSCDAIEFSPPLCQRQCVTKFYILLVRIGYDQLTELWSIDQTRLKTSEKRLWRSDAYQEGCAKFGSSLLESSGSDMARGRSRAAETSNMERFVMIVNGWKPLSITKKRFILDVAATLDPPLMVIHK